MLPDTDKHRSLTVRRRLLPRTRRADQRPAKGASAAARLAVGQASNIEAAHPPDQQLGARARRQRRRDQRDQLGAGEEAVQARRVTE